MRGIADPGGLGAVAQLAIDHTGETGAGTGLGQHGDPGKHRPESHAMSTTIAAADSAGEK